MRVGDVCVEKVWLSVRGGVWDGRMSGDGKVGEICGIEVCGIPYLLHFHTPAPHTSSIRATPAHTLRIPPPHTHLHTP